MLYDRRVAQVLEKPSEQELIQLIKEPIEIQDVLIKAKESAINGLAQFYVDSRTPEKIKSIAIKYI